MSYHCPGCSTPFTSTAARARHISQSQDPRCVSYYRSVWLPSTFPTPLRANAIDHGFSPIPNSRSGPFANEISEDIEMIYVSDISPDPIPFSSNNTPADIEDGINNTTEVLHFDDSETDYQEEEFGDAYQAALETAWEVPRRSATTHPVEDEIERPYNDRSDSTTAEDQHNHRQFQDNLRFTPEVIRYSDMFPESSAGQTIPAPSDSGSTDDESHNLWAPFNSAIDSGIACWAKMRGQGSTAFSELLQVDGVS